MSQGELKGRYSKYETNRTPYLMRARECASLTIPSLLPPEGTSSATRLSTPYQSLGARGVNNLASKLLLTQLPPNSPFFRYAIDDYMVEKLSGKEGMRAGVEEALNKMERSLMTEVETSAIRSPAFEALKLLLVTGNVLLHLVPDGGMKTYRLDRYVAKRDPMGNLLEIITRENISPMELPEVMRKVVGKQDNSGSETKPDTDDVFELYTTVRRTVDNWEVWQEVEGIVVPDSYGTYPLDKTPWMCLRLIAMDGEDYGRGFVEEYLGDLKSLEGLTQSIVECAAVSAKVVFMLKPAASTKASDLAKARSGDIIVGNRADVEVLQVEKYADMRVAKETVDGLKEALSYAFLLNSAIQRNGERVTAEEIRYMANELETTLGGVYSRLSQEFQLPLVTVLTHRMESQGRLPRLPKGMVKPMITTGIEAIGRGQDTTKLSGLMQDIAPLGPEEVAKRINSGDFIKRCGVARGIDMNGLVKTDEEVAQSDQQAQQMAMVQNLGPNAVTQLGGLAKQNMAPQAQPQ